MNRKGRVCLALLTVLSACLLFSMVEVGAYSTSKPLVLRVADIHPPTGTRADYLKKACKEVETLTEGRIKMEIYWSSSLVKTKDMLYALQKGVCDVTWVANLYHAGELPLWTAYTTLLYLPKGDDAAFLTKKAWELFDTSQPLRAELEKYGQTAWFCCPYDSYCLYSKKIVNTLDDLKGMRIRVPGEGASKMMKAIGVHPTSVPAAEVYTVLEKGTVDGTIAGWDWGNSYRLYEVVPYISDLNILIHVLFNNVSLATLKKMSEKDRKIFLEAGRRVSLEYGEAVKREREISQSFMKGKGVKILTFNEAERRKWVALPEVKALVPNWIDEQNKAGRPGSEVMKTFMKVFDIPEWMPPGY
jgi:TRAP-type C4-dicarboxylate transport system substrate-binding protein